MAGLASPIAIASQDICDICSTPLVSDDSFRYCPGCWKVAGVGLSYDLAISERSGSLGNGLPSPEGRGTGIVTGGWFRGTRISSSFRTSHDARVRRKTANSLYRAQRIGDHEVRRVHGVAELPYVDLLKAEAARRQIPNAIRDHAIRLLLLGRRHGTGRGMAISASILASIVLAYRTSGILGPSIDELSVAMNVERLVAYRVYRKMKRILRLKVPLETPEMVLRHLSAVLSLPRPVIADCETILKELSSRPGKRDPSPRALVGGLVYLVGWKNLQTRTQTEIAKAVDVTEVSIRSSKMAILLERPDLRTPRDLVAK